MNQENKREYITPTMVVCTLLMSNVMIAGSKPIQPEAPMRKLRFLDLDN